MTHDQQQLIIAFFCFNSDVLLNKSGQVMRALTSSQLWATSLDLLAAPEQNALQRSEATVVSAVKTSNLRWFQVGKKQQNA